MKWSKQSSDSPRKRNALKNAPRRRGIGTDKHGDLPAESGSHWRGKIKQFLPFFCGLDYFSGIKYTRKRLPDLARSRSGENGEDGRPFSELWWPNGRTRKAFTGVPHIYPIGEIRGTISVFYSPAARPFRFLRGQSNDSFFLVFPVLYLLSAGSI